MRTTKGRTDEQTQVKTLGEKEDAEDLTGEQDDAEAATMSHRLL